MLKSFKKAFLLAGLTSVIVMALVFIVVKAGSLTPSGVPGSTMHNLLEIYNSIAGDNVTFTGTGTSTVMTIGATFTGLSSTHYRVQIDSLGTPDTFKWSADGGATWVQELVPITGASQAFVGAGSNGVTVAFSSMTSHAVGDRWDFYKQVADVDGNIIERLKYISDMTLQQIYNNSGATPTITGSSANAILTLQQTGAGNIFDLRNGTGSIFSISSAGLISGASGQIKAAAGSTFYNNGGYAIAATGEEILRASIPIFGYDFPARTAGTKTISRELTLDVDDTTIFPAVPTGANRKYKFKIQYSNDAVTAGNSVWQITLAGPPESNFGASFNVPNTTIANLNESKVYYTAAFATLPDHATDGKWYLVVTAPASMIIQVYQIELLAYDVLQ